MDYVLLAFVAFAMGAFCFAQGMKYGREKKEPISIPIIPKAVKQKKEVNREMERLTVILQNIECYNGTPEGQKDLPGGG